MDSHSADGLAVELRHATGVLREALTEACGAEVEHLDTGELLRVEEVLALAGEAAHKAASLRRRTRQERPHATPAPVAARVAAPVAAAVGTPAEERPHRVFVDDAGVRWDAFAVFPSADAAGKARLPEPYQRGWLSFDSGEQRRRLSPVPEGWHTMTDDELCAALRRAEPAPKRL